MNTKLLNKSVLVTLLLLGVVLTLGFGIAEFYKQECAKKFEVFLQKEDKRLKEQQLQLDKQKFIEEKAKAEKIVNNLDNLLAKKHQEIEQQIKDKLMQKVQTAYKKAHFIYSRYKNKQSNKKRIITIVKNISKDSDNSLFITNYDGDSILLGGQKVDKNKLSFYMDADARSIILEELHKVRKYKKGFLKSNFYEKNSQYIIYVQDLEMFDMFVGSMQSVASVQKKYEKELTEILRAVVVSNKEFLVLYKDKDLIFASKNIDIKSIKRDNSWTRNETRYYFHKYNKETGYNIVYGYEI